ncbi:hypothetical protein RRG08_014987 [Elysia crispata]|uniref:Uncharacterized protein n=1 Tax=Elysia crispata TaxID=231223 RepID=A0AAE0ZXD5_9GAST|nr:hypothetical protein RRG08_014987 [Elysia crispata]
MHNPNKTQLKSNLNLTTRTAVITGIAMCLTACLCRDVSADGHRDLPMVKPTPHRLSHQALHVISDKFKQVYNRKEKELDSVMASPNKDSDSRILARLYKVQTLDRGKETKQNIVFCVPGLWQTTPVPQMLRQAILIRPLKVFYSWLVLAMLNAHVT